MTTLRTLLLVLTAMIFAFGGLARAGEAPMAEPPCHEAPAQHPDKATLAMSCCVGCMPAPSALPAPVGGVTLKAPAIYVVSSPTLMGRPLAPDTPPPRA